MSHPAFWDRLAPRYDELLARPIDHWSRAAFQRLVQETIPRGSWLLDFGCGTGVDAVWYVQHGYRVLAYDSSTGMLDQLRRRCAAEIQSRTVIPVDVPLAEFAAGMSRYPRADACVSNFAVINSFARPPDFFQAIAPLLLPGAPLVICALNPFFWKDMVRPWWWRALGRSRATGVHAIVSGGEGGEGIETYRHFSSAVVAAARAAAFRLESRGGVGALVRRVRRPLNWDAPRTLAERLERGLWRAPPVRSAGLFTLFTFRRV